MPYAYTQGQKAAEAGKNLTDNLYPSLTDNYYQFEAGYLDYLMMEQTEDNV